jgi:AraC family transcriptional regulator
MEVIVNLLDVANREIRRNQDIAQICTSRAVELLRAESNLVRSSNDEDHGGLPPWKRQLVAIYIEENLSRPLKVDDLALVAKLSSSHFFRVFRRAFGETPRAYLNRRRIVRAMDLMLHGGEPLSQIALACGFADQAHLSRLFRRIQGVTPGHWRRLLVTAGDSR